MLRDSVRLALLGLSGVFADTCLGNGACPAQMDDPSMIQVARLGENNKDEPEQKAFIKNSKPFFAHGKSLTRAQQGRILINEDGVENSYYLPGAHVIDDGKTVEFRPPYRFYLMRHATTDYSNADNFYKPMFMGKTFTVDIDFRKDGPACGCNLNFYLVDMPTAGPGLDNDHYCDAQCFKPGACCSEFDMNEGNMKVQQITNHACTNDYSSHPSWECNKWGDPEVKTHTKHFGSGPGHTIDSNKKFEFSQRFEVSGGDFIFTTKMSQEGREVNFRMGQGNAQMRAMQKELEEGMAFVTGYWSAPDMNWMDGEQCGHGAEHCNMNPAYISNWRITSNGDSPAPPAPPAPPVPPAPPAPPAPAPGAHKCCWGEDGVKCANCHENPASWCNGGKDQCSGACGGMWCNEHGEVEN